MDLRRRLAQLDRLSGLHRGGVPAAVRDDLPDGSRSLVPPAELGFREMPTAAGVCWFRDWRAAIPQPAAAMPDLRGIFSRNGERRPACERILLVDTETTGLAGGTGTLAFLAGLGWWEGCEFVVRQLLLPGPGREGGMLAALAEWAAPFEVVVTYNGASFDLPLLRTRSLMNRRADPLAHLHSWDLLPASRRLWGKTLTDCRQQTVETAVCGIERKEGDIDGARIPEIWLDYIRRGATDGLMCVLRHNQRDLAGMAHILCKVTAAAALVAALPETHEKMDWRQAWALARIAERRRDGAAGAAWVGVAVASGALEGAGTSYTGFVTDAVRILKRERRWLEVERILDAAMAQGRTPWLHREAAILYEHRLPRLETALEHACLSGEKLRVERLRHRLAGTPSTVGTGAG